MEGKGEEREEAAEEDEEGEQEVEASVAVAEEGEGDGSGGQIRTLAEEMPRRGEQEEAVEEEEEEGQRETEAAKTEGEGEGGVFGGWWSFGGLMKKFVTRSESMLEGYRRDLQDLGSGLRLETTALRATAALPSVLEASVSVASDRLESVGEAVDDLGAAAAGLHSHANEV